ncbi:uncharacterized protein TRAVEDRAFT_20345 [Trametes versicolor FP-101664 SS1]|uniref:uncharacterized protein n=1 Tax=Trametes versicolor (strain FP-101664) TaxID=717944 RepID=UPI0004623AC6|nr:uncharacterized protein TRAVEDRAFT_20345 [Trametes versicolor FP-101664 SS1]EIW58293.1 hypothetical protein TRAVEDRAFT_20345 [Trametes versicolor FP-101664 SS1]
MSNSTPFKNGHIAAQTRFVIHANPDSEQPIRDWPVQYLRLALERPACGRDRKNVWVVIELSDKFVKTIPSHESDTYSSMREEDYSESSLCSTFPSDSGDIVGEGQYPSPSKSQGGTGTPPLRDNPNTGEDFVPLRANSASPSPSGEGNRELMDDSGVTCGCWHSVEVLRRENEILRAALSTQDDRISTLVSQVATMMSRLEALTAPQDEAPDAARKVKWDFVYAREAGNVLLVCYAAGLPERTTARRNGINKVKRGEAYRGSTWDEEDRATPGVWPLVAVAHQMLFPNVAAPRWVCKRERSPSPTIGGDSVPQLITEGEDGMVIDWKSKVPVMSDILRPPSTSTSPAKAAPVSNGPSSPPTKKQKLQATSTGETESREHEGDGRARKHGPASPSRRPVQSTSWGELPAPGETIWRQVLPPPRPSVANLGENVLRDAVPYARSGCPSPAVGPSTGDEPAADLIDLTEGDNAEVEVIDLTCTDKPDIQPEDSAPQYGASQTELSTNVSADGDVMEADALRFLQRYIADFATDRAALASAYSRAATFSTQTLPPPHQDVGTAARHYGRLEIIAALLDLPDDEAPLAARKVEYDFVYASKAGDVLLICYTAARVPEQTVARGKGKQKEKATAKLLDGLCEQRFILRPREWDEEDSATPGVWPLVAVAHQMLFRPLPS